MYFERFLIVYFSQNGVLISFRKGQVTLGKFVCGLREIRFFKFRKCETSKYGLASVTMLPRFPLTV